MYGISDNHKMSMNEALAYMPAFINMLLNWAHWAEKRITGYLCADEIFEIFSK